MWDRIKLRIPLVGGVLHRFAIMQFTQSLGTLLAGGTPMVPAIEIASQSVTQPARGHARSPASCRTCARASRCGARWTTPGSSATWPSR